jgi:hypothetical protein
MQRTVHEADGRELADDGHLAAPVDLELKSPKTPRPPEGAAG